MNPETLRTPDEHFANASDTNRKAWEILKQWNGWW